MDEENNILQPTIDPVDPPKQKIYTYLKDLHGENSFSEESLQNISSLTSYDDLKKWVNITRSQNNLLELTDDEYGGLHATWFSNEINQKKKEDSLAEQASNPVIPSTPDTVLVSQSTSLEKDSSSESVSDTERVIDYYTQDVINSQNILPALKSLSRDLLEMNEEDAMVEFNNKLGPYGYSASPTKTGENALQIRLPDGSPLKIDLLSDMGFLDRQSLDFVRNKQNRHNQLLFDLSVKGGGQMYIPNMVSEFQRNPDKVFDVISTSRDNIIEPPYEFLTKLVQRTSGKDDVDNLVQNMFYGDAKFNRQNYLQYLLSAKAALEPGFQEYQEFMSDKAKSDAVRRSPKTLGGAGVADPRTGKIKGQVDSNYNLSESLKTAKQAYDYVNESLKKFEAEERRASRLISHALTASGAIDNLDLSDPQVIEDLGVAGISMFDIPLNGLKLNDRKASFQDIYDIISRPLELGYVRDGSIKVEIDPTKDSGALSFLVEELQELQTKNSAFYDPSNPGLNEFARQIGNLPKQFYGALQEFMHDLSVPWHDALSAATSKEFADFVFYQDYGVHIPGSIGMRLPGFPTVQSIEKTREDLPQYDLGITDARTMSEFLMLGKEAAIQSLPYTLAFVVNPTVGMTTTVMGEYGGSIEEYRQARADAEEMQASGFSLSKRQQELLEMTDAKIRGVAATRAINVGVFTAGFTYGFYKDLYRLRNFKGANKVSQAYMQDLANMYAKKYRSGVIGSMERVYGLSVDALKREMPEEAFIAYGQYGIEVAFGLREYDHEEAMKLAADAGVSAIFTSIPMGIARNQLSKGIDRQADNIIVSNIEIPGQSDALQAKIAADEKIEKLKQKGVDENHPRFVRTKELQADFRNKVLDLEDKKTKLVARMTKGDKAKYLDLLSRYSQQEGMLLEGGKPELIDAYMQNMDNIRGEINTILAKYPSEVGYYFLTPKQKKKYQQEANAELRSKYKDDESYEITQEQIDQRASELFVKQITDEAADFDPVVTSRKVFYDVESYYTFTTPEEAADLDVVAEIANVRSDIFAQESTQEASDVVQAEIVTEEQVEPTEMPPTEKGKTVSQFVNRGAKFKNPVTGETMDGDVYQDGQTIVFEEKKSGKIYELGNAEEIANLDAEQAGIVYEAEKVLVQEDGSLSYEGKNYLIQDDLPTYGVEFDQEGKVKSVSIRERGSDKRVMLTGQDAQDAAVKIYLSKGEKLPSAEDQAPPKPDQPTAEPTIVDVDAVVEDPTKKPEENPDVVRRNSIVDRIEVLNKSNDFYSQLDPNAQIIISDFFKDIKAGRRPRFARVENVLRAQELAYELTTLNPGGIRIFPFTRKDIAKKLKDGFWRNPINAVRNAAADIYPFLNDVGRKSMSGVIFNLTGFTQKNRKNMMTGDVLHGAVFRNQKAGAPFINLWNTANQNTAIAMNQSYDARTQDINALKESIKKYNASLPVSQKNKKINIDGFEIHDDYELQILGHLRRTSGETDTRTGLDTEFLRQKNALLKELELRRNESQKNPSDENLRTRFVLLRDALQELGVADATNYGDVSSKAKTPLVEAIEMLVARFPHDDAQKRKLDYDGNAVFFEKGSYVPTFRETSDGEFVVDGKRFYRGEKEQQASGLKDVTDDDQLETSRIAFGNYFGRAYQALESVYLDIYSRGDWKALDHLVNSQVFRDMFVDDTEYKMVKNYYGTRWDTFQRLLNTQQSKSDYGDRQLSQDMLNSGFDAAYSGVSAIGLGGVFQPASQFYSALSGSMSMLTDPIALNHARRAGARFPLFLTAAGNGNRANDDSVVMFKQIMNGRDLENIYNLSRTNLRNALKAEFAIGDKQKMPLSYYEKALKIKEGTLERIVFEEGTVYPKSVKYNIAEVLDMISGDSNAVLEVFLSNGDKAAANAAFEAHYIQARADQGVRFPKNPSQEYMNAWWKSENENPNKEAIQKADQRVAETMRQTQNTSEAAFYGDNPSASNKASQMIAYAWGKFQQNAKSNFANQIARMYDENLPQLERSEAQRRAEGILKEVGIFNGIKLAGDNMMLFGIISGLGILAGTEEEDIKRFDKISMTNLINDVLLPIEDPGFVEAARNMPKDKIESLEAYRLAMKEDITGITSTILEIYASAYEFQNKMDIGKKNPILLQSVLDFAETANPFPIPQEGYDAAYIILNSMIGEDLMPEYLSRDVERATQTIDDFLVSTLDNAGIVGVAKQQTENVQRAWTMFTNRSITKPLTGGTGQPQEKLLYAPNPAMDKILGQSINTLFAIRMMTLMGPAPRKDLNKLANKLERQIEKNFSVGIPKIPNVNNLFFKSYLEKRTEQGAEINRNDLGSWWESERKNMNTEARRYASDQVYQAKMEPMKSAYE